MESDWKTQVLRGNLWKRLGKLVFSVEIEWKNTWFGAHTKTPKNVRILIRIKRYKSQAILIKIFPWFWNHTKTLQNVPILIWIKTVPKWSHSDQIFLWFGTKTIKNVPIVILMKQYKSKAILILERTPRHPKMSWFLFWWRRYKREAILIKSPHGLEPSPRHPNLP